MIDVEVRLPAGTVGPVFPEDGDVSVKVTGVTLVVSEGGGSGIPPGGTTDQALLKNSNTSGDASWRTLTKTLVGLALVDNTSDAYKPVSAAQAAADAAVQASAAADATSKANAAQAASQPLDGDLTAIAAVSTTTFGRALLAAVDAAALRTAAALGSAATQPSSAFDPSGAAAAAQAASQPLDSDLTSIAGQANTPFGLALLLLANAAGLRTAAGLGTSAVLDAGAANGTATLDGSGRIPSSQLPLSLMDYLGVWNASTNTPTLAAGVGNPGDVYRVGTAGTRDVGEGSKTFDVGDWVIYSSVTSAWEKSDTTDAVASVAGLTGAITAGSLRTALSLVVGTDVQAHDADLDAIAALTTTTFGRALLTLADAAAARTTLGLGSAALANTGDFDVAGAAAAAQAASQPVDADLTAIAALSTTPFGRGLLALADAAALRTAAGLVIGTDVQAFDSDLASIAALTTTTFGRSLLTQADAAATRTALGLGSAALNNTGDFDAAGAAAAAQAASQPVDSDLTAIAALSTTTFGRSLLALADAAAGRTALGLGTAATQASTAFDAAGAAAAAQAASQPVDSDLTAIAALTTTSFGRSLLALADAATARDTLGIVAGIFGDGSDGNVTISGTTTITRDMFYDTLTVQNGGILNTNGWRVHCKTLCQVDLGGTIRVNPNNAASLTGAARTGTGTLSDGSAGANGGTGVGVSGSGVNNGMGGSGGAGGAGVSAGGAGATVSTFANPGFPRSLPEAALGYLLGSNGSGTAQVVAFFGGGGGGGGGGDGTNAGGGGGSGGGVVVINAKAIVNNGTISANGGNGFSTAAGNTGGGGGGGGGCVVTNTLASSGTGTVTVTGGTGGTKSGTGVNGTNGTTGRILANVWS